MNNVWNEEKKNQIKFVDLLWKIIYSWRIILIMMVGFAIIVAGYKYVRDYNAVKVAVDIKQSASIEDLESELTEDEQLALEEANSLEVRIEEKKKYQTESILINLNAYHKNVVTLQYYVDTNYVINYNNDIEKDYTNELVDAYTAYIENKGMLSALTEVYGDEVDSVYVGELISAGRRVSNNGEVSDAVVTANDSFTIYITGTDEQKADELADLIEAQILEYQSLLSGKIGTHDLILVDRYASVVSDTTLAYSQQDLENSITSLETQLSTLVSGFSDIQNQLYIGETSELETSVAGNVGISWKYIVLGMIVGLFLACILIVICFILSNKVISIEKIYEVYGLRVIGVMAPALKKNGIFSGVDRWLSSIRNKEKLTLDEQIELIVTNIKMTCKAENTTSIFITTSLPILENEKNILEQIMASLKKSGVTCEFGADIMRNAKSFEQMAEIGYVMFLEKTGVSNYDLIEKELILCLGQNTKVIGVLGIEA